MAKPSQPGAALDRSLRSDLVACPRGRNPLPVHSVLRSITLTSTIIHDRVGEAFPKAIPDMLVIDYNLLLQRFLGSADLGFRALPGGAS